MLLHVVFTIVYLFICVVLIFLIMIQASRGTGLAGAFGAGGGGAESFLGASSSASVVVKAAIGFAIAFLILTMGYSFVPKIHTTQSVIQDNSYRTMEQQIEVNREQGEVEKPGAGAATTDPGQGG